MFAGIGRLILGDPMPIVVAALGTVAAGLLGLSYALTLTRRVVPGELTILAEEVELRVGNHRAAFSVRDVDSAFIVARALDGVAVPFVEIELQSRWCDLAMSGVSGDSIVVRTSDHRAACELVESLGFGPKGRRLRIDLGTPHRRLVHLGLALASYLAGVAGVVLISHILVHDHDLAYLYGIPASAVVALLIFEMLKVVMCAPRVSVGGDGVEILRGLRHLFVPRTDILSVEQISGTLIIRQLTGDLIRLGGLLTDPDRTRVIADRIGVNSDAVPKSSRFMTYARGGRSLGEWRENLRRVVLAVNYRSDVSAVEEATDILTAPQATSEERIGAALALRIAGEGSASLRIARETIAHKRLREAIDEIAEANDEAAVDRAVRRAL